MARRYGRIDEWETWIPDIDQERELFQSDPNEAVSMEIRFLSKQERDQYERSRVAALTTGALDKSARDRYMRALFADHVRNVKNYEYDAAPVTDGGGLWDCDEIDLCVGVTSALLRRSSLEEGLAKKLRSESGTSSQRRIPRSNGDAPNATPPSTPTTPAASAKRETCDSQTPPSAGTEVVIGGPRQSSTPGPESTISDGARRAS